MWVLTDQVWLFFASPIFPRVILSILLKFVGTWASVASAINLGLLVSQDVRNQLDEMYNKAQEALNYLKEEMRIYRLQLQWEYVDLLETDRKPHLHVPLELEEGWELRFGLLSVPKFVMPPSKKEGHIALHISLGRLAGWLVCRSVCWSPLILWNQ